MIFILIIPEFGQLFVLGSVFILAGFLFRKIRNTISSFRKVLPIPSEEEPAPRRS